MHIQTCTSQVHASLQLRKKGFRDLWTVQNEQAIIKNHVQCHPQDEPDGYKNTKNSKLIVSMPTSRHFCSPRNLTQKKGSDRQSKKCSWKHAIILHCTSCQKIRRYLEKMVMCQNCYYLASNLPVVEKVPIFML